MLINSVKLLKKSRLALWLTSALFLVSCLSLKQQTQTETDSVVNKDIQIEEDSLTSLEVEQNAERLQNCVEESETTLIFFDTSKPADENTGLPPVKAIAQQKVKREEQQQEAEQKQTLCETEQRTTTTDRTVEEISTEVEVDHKHTWWEVFKQRLMYILLVIVTALILWTIYKLIKIFK